MSSPTSPSWQARLLSVDHSDNSVKIRATNALVVLYGVIILGAIAAIPLALGPGGRVSGPVTLAVGVVAAISVVLVRRGHVDAGLGLFFIGLLAANLAEPFLGQNARLSAIYLLVPVAIAGVTLDWLGLALVAVAAVSIGAISTFTHPPVDPPVSAMEIVTAGVLVTTAVLVTTWLGRWGLRREAARADTEVRHAKELSENLRAANVELESRVTQRTDDLQHALARQESLVAELAELSMRDPLTGLYNRRYADYELPRLLAAAERYEQPLSMAMVDLDNFKLVNDNHSYAVGDAVLRRFAQLMRETARSSDVLTRYGGEEFLLVMPHTGRDSGQVLCERLREAVATFDWESITPGLSVTVSVGVAATRREGGLVTLVADADAALHDAKRSGRNRVIVAASS